MSFMYFTYFLNIVIYLKYKILLNVSKTRIERLQWFS